MNRSRVEKWQRWLVQINDQVSSLFLYRAIWRSMAQAIDGNPAIPRTPALNMIAPSYAMSQAIAVRRLADSHRDAVSFTKLLSEIIKDPAALTARSALPTGELVDILAWERRFAGGVPGGHVDPGPLCGDLASLTAAAEPIKRNVDRHIAHLDEQPLRQMPTFAELDSVVDHLGELSRRCELLLHMADRVPMPVMPGDPMAAFSVPWVPSEMHFPQTSRAAASRQ